MTETILYIVVLEVALCVGLYVLYLMITDWRNRG